MQDRGMTTFAEVPLEWGEENQRSECHPWSSSPNVFLFKTVCGINPTSAGHKTVEIAPSFGELKQIKAVYPHLLGNIEMNLNKENSKLTGEISIPSGMEAILFWNGKKQILAPGKNKINKNQ
jgi:hypothetical protein